MSETNTRQLYPHTTSDGTPIPFDILFADGVGRLNISDVVSNALAIPATAELLMFYCDIDCFVKFDADASVPANEAYVAGLHYIPADVGIIVEPSGAANLKVIAVEAGATGILWVQGIKKWRDLLKKVQFERG